MQALLTPFLLLLPMFAISWSVYFFIVKEMEKRRLMREGELEEISRTNSIQTELSAVDFASWKILEEKLARKRRTEHRILLALLIASVVASLASAIVFLVVGHESSSLGAIAYKIYFLSLFTLAYASFGLLTGRKSEKR